MGCVEPSKQGLDAPLPPPAASRSPPPVSRGQGLIMGVCQRSGEGVVRTNGRPKSVSRRGGRNKGGRKQTRANADKRRQTLTNASKRKGENASKREQTRANVDKRKQTLTPPFIAVFYTPLGNPLTKGCIWRVRFFSAPSGLLLKHLKTLRRQRRNGLSKNTLLDDRFSARRLLRSFGVLKIRRTLNRYARRPL